MFTADDRWYIQGDHRFQWSSQNTYGLGAATLKSSSENVKFTGVKVYETAYRRVAPGLFAGAALNISSHSSVRPTDGLLPAWEESAYITCNQDHGLSPGNHLAYGELEYRGTLTSNGLLGIASTRPRSTTPRPARGSSTPGRRPSALACGFS